MKKGKIRQLGKSSLSLVLALLMLIGIVPIVSMPVSAASYNATAAANYALNHWNNYNPSYSNYNSIGGDCANFVSQCLVAGGMKMNSDWFWYSYSNKSASWSGALSMKKYLVDKLGYELITYPRASQIAIGDVLWYDEGSHVAICTEIIDGVPWVCAHNKDLHTKNWKLGFSKYAVIKMSGSVPPTPSPDIDSSYPTPFQCYTKKGETYEVYSSVNGSKTGGWIAKDDICTINEVYTNGWVKVTYPVSNGTRTAYSPKSEFFDSYSNIRVESAIASSTAYRRSDLSQTRGTVESGDKCTVIGESGDYYCVICPWSNSSVAGSGKLLVWVAKSAFKSHSHDYKWNYESAHPHKEYMKCSCGEWYYTGENYFDEAHYISFFAVHPHYEVKVCNVCGWDYTEKTGGTRYVDTCTTCNPPLADVPTISSATVSGQTVTVKWSEAKNATSYDVYLVASPWGWGDIKYSKTGLTSTSYTFTNVAFGYYKAFVIARPQSDNQKQSNWVSVDITYELAKPVLKNMKSSYIIDEQVTFTWDPTENTTHYNIYIDKHNGSDYVRTENAFYAENGMTRKLAEGKYRVCLQSANSNGHMPNSSDWIYRDGSFVYFTVVVPKYTIKFEGNGGTWSYGNATKTHGVNRTIPDAWPERKGYTFIGWSTSANGSVEYYGGSTYSKNSDITLYAQWTPNLPGKPTLTLDNTKYYAKDTITATWTVPENVTNFDLKVTDPDGNIVYSKWTMLKTTTSHSFTLDNPGTYKVSVAGVNDDLRTEGSTNHYNYCKSIEIVVLPLPTLSFSVSSNNFEVGEEVTFYFEGTNNNGKYDLGYFREGVYDYNYKGLTENSLKDTFWRVGNYTGYCYTYNDDGKYAEVWISFKVYGDYSVNFDANGGALDNAVKSSAIVDAINTGREYGTTVVYNKSGESTETNIYGFEVLVDATGKVIDKQSGKGSAIVPENGFIISEHDDGEKWIPENISIGDYVSFNEETKEIKVYATRNQMLSDSINVTFGYEYGELPVPMDRPGYTFNGWQTSEKVDVTATTVVNTKGDHTLYAQWTPNIPGKPTLTLDKTECYAGEAVTATWTVPENVTNFDLKVNDMEGNIAYSKWSMLNTTTSHSFVLDKPGVYNVAVAGVNEDLKASGGTNYYWYSDGITVTVLEKEVPVTPVATLTITGDNVYAGEIFEVPIIISDNKGLSGLKLDITYASELELVSVVKGEALESLDMTTSKETTANPYIVTWDGLAADSSNGTIATVTFKAKKGTPDGEYNIDVKVGMAIDENVQDAYVKDTSAKITVKACTSGDTNNDGEIDLKDVITLRRGIVGGYQVVTTPAFDVNDDGEINLKDVILIRRYIVGGYGVEFK